MSWIICFAGVQSRQSLSWITASLLYKSSNPGHEWLLCCYTNPVILAMNKCFVVIKIQQCLPWKILFQCHFYLNALSKYCTCIGIPWINLLKSTKEIKDFQIYTYYTKLWPYEYFMIYSFYMTIIFSPPSSSSVVELSML